MNVLFTSLGRRVELIEQWQLAFKNAKRPGNIFGTDINPLAPAFQIVSEGFVVPMTTSAGFISKLTEICKKRKIDLIFPLIDPDIPVLARNKMRLEKTGAKLILINDNYIQITQDKWFTYKFFKSLGLQTPMSWLPDNLIATDILNFPVFIKPRSGSASIGAIKIDTMEQLEAFIPKTNYPIIQEFIEGEEVTCDVICSLKGEVLSVIPRQRIEVRSGEVAKGKTIYHKSIIRACVKIAQALKAIGPITIQCILRDDIPYFIEINPRYGGGAPLGIAAGAKSPEWYIKEFLNIPFTVPPIGEYIKDLYMTRADQTFFLSENEIQRIKNNNI